MGVLNERPGSNWIERLPAGLRRRFERSIIYRAAIHMHAEHGMDVGHAIASAINWAEHIKRTGDVKQWPGPQRVRPSSVAECVSALATWDAMKTTNAALHHKH